MRRARRSALRVLRVPAHRAGGSCSSPVASRQLCRGPDRPRHEAAPAVRADVLQDVAHAVVAERALVGADARSGVVRREVAVAELAVRTQFKHPPSVPSRRGGRRVRPAHRGIDRAALVHDETRLVAALGDSITAGTPYWDPDPEIRATIGPELDERHQWGYWAERANPGIRVRNHGVNGERTDQIAARLDARARGRRHAHRAGRHQRHRPGQADRARAREPAAHGRGAGAPPACRSRSSTCCPGTTASPPRIR